MRYTININSKAQISHQLEISSVVYDLQNSVVEYNNRKEYWFNNNLHRLDGPAIVDDGCEFWFVDGKAHRIDGPAKTFNYAGVKQKEYWVDGKFIKVEKCI